MNKACRIAIPLILACALLGLAIYLSSASSRALASTDSIARASENQPALNPALTQTQSNLLVTTLDDELNSDGDCSLREAIEAANTNSEVDACGSGDVLTDTITFNVTGTINLVSQLEVTVGGSLFINGGNEITLSGQSQVRIIYLQENADLTIENIVLTQGHDSEAGAIINYGSLAINHSALSDNIVTQADQRGGAISNYGNLSIANSSLIGNSGYFGGNIYNEGNLAISSSTISSGSIGWPKEDGAGIYNTSNGNVSIMDSIFTANDAHGNGGAIWNDGQLTITSTNLSDNDAQYEGPGIYNHDNGIFSISESYLINNHSGVGFGGAIGNHGEATIIHTAIFNNSGAWGGGGINNVGNMQIINSTVEQNFAAGGGGISNGGVLSIVGSTLNNNLGAGYSGGGISNSGLITITNSTLSGNTVTEGYGGAIVNSGDVILVNTTFANNSSDLAGGAIYNYPGYGQAIAIHSIFAYSSLGGNCAGDPMIDGGFNMEDTDTCGFEEANGSHPNTDPLLGPLQINGGPTWTHALLEGSPAIDAGDNEQCPPTDQRGVPRPLDGDGDGVAICDIGSYELEPGQLVVTTLDDIVDSEDGLCSLREAIQAANSNLYVEDCGSGIVLTDTITFDVVGTIVVTNQLEVTDGGPLVIDGGEVITTSGGGTTRVWWVEEGSHIALKQFDIVNGVSDQGGALYNNAGEVSITNVSISQNQASVGGGIINMGILLLSNSTLENNEAWGSYGSGGGIYNHGSLEIISSTLIGNVAWYHIGGAINNQGTLSIRHSLLSGNSAYHDGGVIYNNQSTMTISNSTISGGGVNYKGGGILNYSGTMTITNSTLSNLHALYGGGIYNQYGVMSLENNTLADNHASYDGGAIFNDHSTKMTLTNSTLSANSAGWWGGGIRNNYGILEINNSTITGNNADNGGGVYGGASAGNSIVANNPSGGDCDLPLFDKGHNIDSDGTCGLDPDNGSLPNTDPLLGPLQDNGGPTFTHALLPGSPAIDAGDDAQCPSTDQRGVARPLDGDNDGVAICDIGSYEREYIPVSPSQITISGPGEGYLGPVIYFTATVEPVSTTLPLTYVWQASQHPPITHTTGLTDTAGWAWELPGTYAITVTAGNLAGSVTGTHQISLSDVPISGLTASNDSPTLLGDPTTFTATISEGTNVSYEWSFGDGSFGQGETITHTYAELGEFTAIVTATNSANIETTATQVAVIPGTTSTYLPLVTRAGAPPRAGMPSSAPSAGLLVGLVVMLVINRRE